MPPLWIFLFFAISFLSVVVFFAIRSLFKKSTSSNKGYDLPGIDLPGFDDFHAH